MPKLAGINHYCPMDSNFTGYPSDANSDDVHGISGGASTAIKLVTLDTSDNYSFGVDISKLGGFGISKLLTFSSFGISTLDPKTGSLTPSGRSTFRKRL